MGLIDYDLFQKTPLNAKKVIYTYNRVESVRRVFFSDRTWDRQTENNFIAIIDILLQRV